MRASSNFRGRSTEGEESRCRVRTVMVQATLCEPATTTRSASSMRRAVLFSFDGRSLWRRVWKIVCLSAAFVPSARMDSICSAIFCVSLVSIFAERDGWEGEYLFYTELNVELADERGNEDRERVDETRYYWEMAE